MRFVRRHRGDLKIRLRSKNELNCIRVYRFASSFFVLIHTVTSYGPFRDVEGYHSNKPLKRPQFYYHRPLTWKRVRRSRFLLRNCNQHVAFCILYSILPGLKYNCGSVLRATLNFQICKVVFTPLPHFFSNLSKKFNRDMIIRIR